MAQKITQGVLYTDLAYGCGRQDRYEGYVNPMELPYCPDCGEPVAVVEREVERRAGVDVTGTGIKDRIVLDEGSLEQAAVTVALADGLPTKIEAVQRLVGTGGLTNYELDVIAKGLALAKADALTRIARAN